MPSPLPFLPSLPSARARPGDSARRVRLIGAAGHRDNGVGVNQRQRRSPIGGSVNTIAECTVPEKILLAAYQLEEQGQSPFSAEALIVAAWQKYPRTFGLKGYDEQYPDSNKVLASIMGEKGLARRGWLIKMGQKLYSLSHEGRRAVRRLMQGEDQPETIKADRPVKLTKEHDKLLQGL